MLTQIHVWFCLLVLMKRHLDGHFDFTLVKPVEPIEFSMLWGVESIYTSGIKSEQALITIVISIVWKVRLKLGYQGSLKSAI